MGPLSLLGGSRPGVRGEEPLRPLSSCMRGGACAPVVLVVCNISVHVAVAVAAGGRARMSNDDG